MKNINTKFGSFLNENRTFSFDFKVLSAKENEIISVKRNSDDEVFTIGDKVMIEDVNHEIVEMYISHGKLILDMGPGGWQYLEDIKK
jgi:hypothetical protein